MGAEQKAWAARLEADHSNLLAALAWSRGQAGLAGAHLRLAGALARFWTERGHLTVVGARLCARRSPRMGATPSFPRWRGRWSAPGRSPPTCPTHEEARASCTRALEIFRRLGDRAGIARTLVTLGVVAHDVSGLSDRGRSPSRELGTARGARRHARVANVLNNMGAIAWRMGRWDEARALLEEALEHAERAGDPGIRVLALTNLGLVAVVRVTPATCRGA